MEYKDIIEIFLSIIGLGLSVIAITISISTNKKQIKINLFKMRMQIYNECEKLISEIIANTDCNEQVLKNFMINTSKVIFVFDEDIQEYIKELYNKARRLRMQNLRQEFDKAEEVISYFSDIVEKEELPKKFEKYLKISEY